jgi:hypothetical protein
MRKRYVDALFPELVESVQNVIDSFLGLKTESKRVIKKF